MSHFYERTFDLLAEATSLTASECSALADEIGLEYGGDASAHDVVEEWITEAERGRPEASWKQARGRPEASWKQARDILCRWRRARALVHIAVLAKRTGR